MSKEVKKICTKSPWWTPSPDQNDPKSHVFSLQWLPINSFYFLFRGKKQLLLSLESWSWRVCLLAWNISTEAEPLSSDKSWQWWWIRVWWNGNRTDCLWSPWNYGERHKEPQSYRHTTVRAATPSLGVLTKKGCLGNWDIRKTWFLQTDIPLNHLIYPWTTAVVRTPLAFSKFCDLCSAGAGPLGTRLLSRDTSAFPAHKGLTSL